jgi:hypothetical protein
MRFDAYKTLIFAKAFKCYYQINKLQNLRNFYHVFDRMVEASLFASKKLKNFLSRGFSEM